MLINPEDKPGHIRREIYGNFSEHLGRCIYGGIYVGENSPIPNIHGLRKDVIEAFRQIRLPVLRWPGGCFADEYHWKDGIGDKAGRKRMVNTNWGGVVEDNSFGTHEFMELCELVGCEPYIAGNLGSGTVQELSEWVEYMTFDGVSPMAEARRRNGREAPWKLKYLGIGNENWGCGGNMEPEFYLAEYRRYQSFCKNFGGNRLFKIACGPSGGDAHWTEVIMRGLRPDMAQGISLHFYTVPEWEHKGSARVFDDAEYLRTIDCAWLLDEHITKHSEIMNRYDPEHRIGLIVDEWGTWFDVEPGTNPGFLYQQNTMRDAMVAALSLNILNRHSRRVVMANIAQAVNVLQAVVLTDGEKMIKTPTFHVFDLYKEHQDGDAVYCYAADDRLAEGSRARTLSTSASVKDGVLTLTLANCSLTDAARIDCAVSRFPGKLESARILTQEVHACNDFDDPENVRIEPFDATYENGVLRAELPPCSVVELRVRAE